MDCRIVSCTCIFTVFKIIQTRHQLGSAADVEKCKYYEKIADYCCDLSAHHQAVASYKKTVSKNVDSGIDKNPHHY